MLRYLYASVVVMAAGFFLSVPAQAQWLDTPLRILSAKPQPRPPDSILVKFRGGKTPAGLRLANEAILTAGGKPALLRRREIQKLGIQVYKLAEPARLDAVLAQVKRMPEVLWAEPNYRVVLLIDPDDTYYAMIDTEHDLFDNEWPYQWPLQFIQAADAWSVWPNQFYTAANKPANSVRVAVIDSGIDTGHPDFKNAGGASTDSALGGQIDMANSRYMFNGMDNETPNDPTDDFGHGTHVAGIVAAATNNAEGVASIGYNGRIIALKVTDPSGDGDDADVIDSIIWAVDKGAMVINISLALNGGYSQGLQDAINYAWMYNVLVVAASGNDGTDYIRRYPAACNKVLAVGATTFANENTIPPYEALGSYSNRGLYVGIAAPGGDATYWNGGEFGFIPELNTLIWSTTPTYPSYLTSEGITEYTYGYLNGTSMASPHVAGLATLYVGYKGFNQSSANAPSKIMKAIQKGADNVAGRYDGGWTNAVGHGRINAYNTMVGAIGYGRDDATPGCITGQATYYGTPVQNAALTAIRQGTTRKYAASSKEDGTYRLVNLPAGTYAVSCNFFGLLKSKTVVVDIGCDTPAIDFEMDASGVNVSVTPHTATVSLGGTKKFTAVVTGASNSGVIWSVIEGPGTVDTGGNYYAPTSPPATNIAHVQATSLADPTKFDIAEVTISVTPLSVTFSANPILGGTSLSGTVTLSGNAPVGGATITLVSNEAAAVVPASISISQGNSSGNFTITTSVVTAPKSAAIAATYNGGTATGTLTISPPSPASMTINPDSIYGSKTTTATVTLNANAPAGGTLVTLSSSDTAVATAPATVTVAAGSNSANFTVTGKNVSADATAKIRGTAFGNTAEDILIVKVALPTALSLEPTDVRGGKTAVGTVTLTGPAPTGGLTINLSSGNPALATVPATMKINAGSSSGNFTITAIAVAAVQTVTISAEARGVTLVKTLTVSPAIPKTLAFSPNPVIGGNTVTGTLTLDGSAAAGGLTVVLTNYYPTIISPPASVTVPAGATSVSFTFGTFAVSSQKVVKVYATANGRTIFPNLTVKP